MKIVLLLLSFCVLNISFMSSVRADDVDHYEGKVFEKRDEAMKALIETTQKMAAAVASEDFDIAQMEEIHEISYTTEDAIAFLDKKNSADLSTLAAALEEVHNHSERHKADMTKRHFITYQSLLISYLADIE